MYVSPSKLIAGRFNYRPQSRRYNTFGGVCLFVCLSADALISDLLIVGFCFCSLWPDVVRQRIKTTYMYFGGSLVFTAASAVAAVRSPAVMNLMMKNSWMVCNCLIDLIQS